MEKTTNHLKKIITSLIYILLSLSYLASSLQLCQHSQNNCVLCINQFNCILCNEGYYPTLSVYDSQCEACPNGCSVCSSTTCIRCYRGWEMNLDLLICQCRQKKGLQLSSQTCIACTTTNCLSCKQNHEICTECSYSLGVSNNNCIPCTTLNCQNCIQASTCIFCSGSLGLSLGECVPCIDTNCLLCNTDASTCTKCIPGYGPGIAICEPCSVPSCENCDTAYDLCDACYSPFGPYGNSCLSCTETSCLQCNRNPSKCITCVSGYGFDLDLLSQGLCLPCFVPHCRQCLDFKVCTGCNIGYAFTDGYCTNCSSMQYCTSCGGLGCDICANGYGKLSFLACLPCQIQGCISCEADFSECDGCQSGLGYDSSSGSCINCAVPNCILCGPDYNSCEACADLKGLTATFTCQPCSQAACLRCPKDRHVCSACQDSYGLNQQGQCVPCLTPHCLQCPTNYIVCILCMNGYGLNGRRCQSCISNLAYQCFFDISASNYCIQKYGVNEAGICVSCSVDHCYACDTIYTRCNYCQNGYGVVPSTGQCDLCADPNCMVCGAGISLCGLCKPGYFNDNSNCVSCAVDYCANCYNDVLVCSSCIDGYGYDSGSCHPCPTNCSYCFIPSTCIQCNENFGIDTNNLCGICPTQCSVCDINNVDICVSCVDGYYLETSICSPCPIQCATCQPVSTTQFECFSCSNYYQINTSVIPQSCFEICGDEWVINNQCDLPLGVEWDGCSDQCEIETDFQCETFSNSSICSFTNSFSFNFVSIKRTHDQSNELQLIVEIHPPLSMFSNSNLLPVFSLSPSVTVKSVKFDKQKGRLILIADFDASFAQKTQLTISFTPLNQTDQRYFASIESNQTLAMPKQNQSAFIFIDTSKILLIKLLNICSYASVVITWISFLMGLLLRKLAGIEAMMTLQFIYLSILWLNSSLSLPFFKLFPLKYSTGFNYPFFGSSTNFNSMEAPFISQFSLSENYFLNNLNIMLIFQIVSIISLLVALARAKILLRNYDNFDFLTDFPDQKQLDNINKHRQLSLQCLLYFTMFNLLNEISCSTIFLKSDNNDEIINIVFLTIVISISVATFLKFFADPDPFDYFRYSFRLARHSCLQSFCFNHCLILCFFLTLSLLLMSLLASLPFLPLLPLLIILVYSIIIRPYELFRQNLRSIFNLLVLCLVILFRILLHFGPSPFLNQTISYPLIVIVFSVLPLTVAIWAFLSLIYQLVHKICYTDLENEMNNQDSNFLKRPRNEILFKLSRAQVRQKMKNMHENPQNSVFKRIVSPQTNLLDYSNAIFEQVLETQKQLMKDMKKAPIRLQKLSNNGKSQKLHLNLQKIGDTKAIHTNKYTVELQKIVAHNQKEENKKIDIQNSSPLAKQILADENKFVQYKGSVQYVEKKMIKLQSPNKNIYLQIYDDMENKEVPKNSENQASSHIKIT